MPTNRVMSASGSAAQAFLLMLLVACGSATASGAPSSPSEPAATASPSASATTAPLDIAEEFVRLAGEMDTFASEISGTMRVGATEGVMSGETEIVDGAVASRIVIVFPGPPERRTESITVGGVTYNRIDDGRWLQAAPATGEPTGTAAGGNVVAEAFASAEDLDVVGTEEDRGRTLHRLESGALTDVSPSDLGLSDDLVTDFSAEVAFLAEDDGTPTGLIFEAAWVQDIGGQPLDVEMELRYMLVDRDLAIEAPDDAWVQHVSAELGYRMLYPATWDVAHEPAVTDLGARDVYLAPVDGEVQVFQYTDLGGSTANEWFRGSAELLAEEFSGPLELDIVSLPAGLDAHVFTTQYTDSGDTILFRQAVIVGADVAWDINWYSDLGNLAGTEEEDRALFMEFVTSFEPSAAD